MRQMLRPDASPDWRGALAELGAAYAPETLAHNRRQFGAFERWCRERAFCPLPASPEVVAAHIDDVHPGLRCKSVVVRLGAIRKVHGLFHYPDPTVDRVVRLAVRRGRRAVLQPQRQAKGLTRALKAEVLAGCGGDLTGLRDRLMINLAYDGLLRAGELMALRVEDVCPLAGGMARLHIPSAKNDPFGEGASAFITAATHRELQTWLEAAGIGRGAVLRRVWRGRVTGGAMHPSSLGRRLRATAAAAGLPPQVVRRLSGHSPRVGAAQDLVAEGRSLLEIMRAGRWRDVDAVARYAREATVNIWSPRPATSRSHLRPMEDAG